MIFTLVRTIFIRLHVCADVDGANDGDRGTKDERKLKIIMRIEDEDQGSRIKIEDQRMR